jgi:adenylate cyclase
MRRRPRFTLGQWLLLSTLALALVVIATFYVFLASSRRAILARSDELRDAAARRIDRALSAELDVGATAVDEIAMAMRFGALPAEVPSAVEASLFSELLDHPTLSDVTWTHATRVGYGERGGAWLAPIGRWQITVYRASADPGSAIFTLRTRQAEGHFVSDLRRRPPGGALLSAPFERVGNPPDPTQHPTFQTAASRPVDGRAIWSDLSYSELDAGLPKSQRRVVVTVQQAIDGAPGRFAGVLRAGILTQTIDALPQLETMGPKDPTRVFLCDDKGRLVAKLSPDDRLESVGDDLRIAPAHVPPPIAAALALPSLRELSPSQPKRSDGIEEAGRRYLVTFRRLQNSQGWVAGMVVPEDYYTHDLRMLRDRFLLAFLVTIAILLGAGAVTLTRLRQALGRIVSTTARMRRFDFAPSPTDAPFRDVADVMDGVERAKTSMRSLGKYVPIDLVRELYESNREPQLGGELIEVSLMFSDIERFTNLSERLTPDALARALGLYLEVMTAGVRSTDGTIDKFIGDSVMAFWNAPRRLPDHARRAARAVLACLRGTRELFASEAWRGLPPLFTRFGLHTGRVMVGHFGAPERLSYTALGDGVNLASRLEGLCKQYGVAVLASEAFVEATADEFAYRRIDKVAVKGKHEAVCVHELLGVRAESAEAVAAVAPYEHALQSYFARQFDRAIDLLRSRDDDPPSRVLRQRCEALIAHPPPTDWNGVNVAASK